jgi:hypothetical protein
MVLLERRIAKLTQCLGNYFMAGVVRMQSIARYVALAASILIAVNAIER